VGDLWRRSYFQALNQPGNRCWASVRRGLYDRRAAARTEAGRTEAGYWSHRRNARSATNLADIITHDLALGLRGVCPARG